MRSGARQPIPLGMRRQEVGAELTAAQLRFADEHGAMAGLWAATGPDSVFLYREDPDGAQRWLVDGDRQVIDTVWFNDRQ
jgi:hypothetical protein